MSIIRNAKRAKATRAGERAAKGSIAFGALALASVSLLSFLAYDTSPREREQAREQAQEREQELREAAPPHPPANRRQAIDNAIIEEVKRIRKDQVREIVTCYRALEQEALRHFKLTRQEKVVAEQVLRELSQEEIAAQLGLSVNTIKSHLRSIYDKAGVNSSRALRILVRERLNSVLE